jgi:hypothetical protein
METLDTLLHLGNTSSVGSKSMPTPATNTDVESAHVVNPTAPGEPTGCTHPYR